MTAYWLFQLMLVFHCTYDTEGTAYMSATDGIKCWDSSTHLSALSCLMLPLALTLCGYVVYVCMVIPTLVWFILFSLVANVDSQNQQSVIILEGRFAIIHHQIKVALALFAPWYTHPHGGLVRRVIWIVAGSVI